MTARSGPGPLLPILLLAVSGWLGWHIYGQVQNPPQPEFPGAVSADDAALPAGGISAVPQGENLPPIDSFYAIVERPLFSPTRRPPSEEVVIVDEPRSELSVTLVGVIISAEEQIAIVSPDDGTGIIRLRRGDELLGWTVAAIEPDRVTFRRDDEEARVELSYDRAPVRPERPKRQRQRQEQNDQNQTQ